MKHIVIVFFKKSVFETVKYIFSFQDFFLRFKWSDWRLRIKCVVHETIKKVECDILIQSLTSARVCLFDVAHVSSFL